ncbi:MAG: hypothetical protein GQF41_4442 [Candidatus Rifleibacterium amylolyticum]|nr:MAG: hypothetical protein GQF41_4442 [Candidatus Rifleibacterium amylolyticum]
MKRMFYTLLAVTMLVMLSPNILPGGETVRECCRKQYLIYRSDNPWGDYTKSYEQEQAGKQIAAVELTDEYERIVSLASYTIDGQSLLADDRKNQRIVANQAFFSPLARPDVTALRAGEKFIVGKALDSRLYADPGFLVSFLMYSQLIQTYHHMEATLNLRHEEDSTESFSAIFDGVHVYFTNEKNEHSYSFKISIDKKTGEISVTKE